MRAGIAGALAGSMLWVAAAGTAGAASRLPGMRSSPGGEAAADPLDENTAIAYQYFVTHTSLTPVQVAGLEGNLLYESGGALNPAQIQFGCTLPPGPCGVGIAQWTDPGSRFDALVSLAHSEGEAWWRLGVQLQFVWQELTGTYAGAGSALEACSTARCATSVVEDDYEIPAHPSASYPERLADANEILASYGVTLGSRVAVASNADGRLEVFGIGDNGQSYSSWQTSPDRSWTQWSPIGDAVGLPPSAPIAVAPNADGRLQMFVAGNGGQTYSTWQTTPDGHWRGWAPLGGSGPIQSAAPLAVAENADGRLQLFAVGTDGESYSNWQTTPDGHWSGWTTLGGPIALPAAAPVSVATNAGGRLQAFAVAANGQPYSTWQTAPDGKWTQWSPIGGAVDLPPSAPIAVASNADGRLQMFVVANGGQTDSSWQTTRGGQWSGWAPLGGSGPLQAGAPISVARDSGGRLRLFAVGPGGQSYSSGQTSPNGRWSAWWAFGGALALPPAAPTAVAPNADGRLQVLVVDGKGRSLSSWQSGLTGAWTTWSSLGGTP